MGSLVEPGFMIISHRYKYLFIQLPRTGCTSIARELIDYYDGKRIHRKHSTYRKFLKHATEEEKNFFVFSGIRNPLDRTVSEFAKFKNNHGAAYTDAKKIAEMTDPIRRTLTLRRFRYVQKNQADFESYFLKFYRFPYDDWSCLDHKKFDFIIRFEHLQEDFAEVLRMLSIPQVRPLPLINKTGGKEKTYAEYFTPPTRQRAKRIFGPFMDRWDYSFPADWGLPDPSWLDKAELGTVNFFRKLLWKNQ